MARFSDTNLNAQRARLFDALQSAGVDGITTIQARHELNILAPAPRVFELRHNYGKNIRTVWTHVVNCWCVSRDRFNAGDSFTALVQGLRDHPHHDLHLQTNQERQNQTIPAPRT